MINNDLFRKAVEDSGLSMSHISHVTNIPESRIKELMDSAEDVTAAEIQSLSDALKMSDAMRRNAFFNRNLPLD